MESVVVAHGLWMPGWETTLLRRRLGAAGFAAYLYRFPTVGEGLDANAARLVAFVAQIPGDTVHFVGHSLGGVVVLTAFASAPHATAMLARPGRIVCLGSPLTGSRAARGLAALPGGSRILGKCMRDLVARGGLPPWSGAREVGVIAGDSGFGMGRVLARLPRPHDGTVAVVETQLPGITDHIVIGASHTALPFSRAAAAQTCHFLRRGRFDHPERSARD